MEAIEHLLHSAGDFLNSIGAEFDPERCADLFLYQPDSPMLFTTGQFFFLFIAFYAVFTTLRSNMRARIIYVTLFSLYFYYKTGGLWFMLLIFTATSDYLVGRCIASCAGSGARRRWLVALSMCVNLGMLSAFKYASLMYNMFLTLLQSAGKLFHVAAWEQTVCEPFDVFLPVGISFFTFQSMSYIIDIYRGRVAPLKRWVDYLFYISFFPGLVAGPIVRACDFIPQMYGKPALSREQMGEGLYLVICGMLKKCVISDYISVNFVDRIFDAPALYTGVENLLGVYGYALQIYCDFSGYSDMAIGIALWLGIRFRINFDSPYRSATVTEFWRRWHISLSTWLKDYLYVSLGGNRKGLFRTYVNLFLTMLLGGLWHGASWRFMAWGAFHGIALAAHKWVMAHFGSFRKTGKEMTPLRRVAGIILTFHLVCFGWIFFRADSVSAGCEVLKRIFTAFHPEALRPFVEGYPVVTLLLALGYVIHFLPARTDGAVRRLVTRSPLLLQALYLVIAVFVAVQFRSAGIVPFIYFQF
ncbi:MAG: MBOAT family protein [Tannerella sp.]|jgi:D-alanyl-lipoteichoic acid acyltransferase DltB (MBOAT superfamily)|nr:MBOAT family protein [Tannerella sp.]